MPDEADPKFSDQLAALAPAIKAILAEPISDSARQAQNACLALAGSGLIIQLGFVSLKKASLAGLDLEPATGAAAKVLLAVAIFFYLRFLLLFARDRAFALVTKGQAALVIDEVFAPLEPLIIQHQALPALDERVVGLSERMKTFTDAQAVMLATIRRVNGLRRAQLVMDFLFPAGLCVALGAAILLPMVSRM